MKDLDFGDCHEAQRMWELKAIYLLRNEFILI